MVGSNGAGKTTLLKILARVIAPTSGRVRGSGRVVSLLELHAAQIQGFFDIPVDNLFAGPLFGKDIQDTLANRELTVVSPDVGGVVRARAVAKRINADLAIIDKRREQAGVSEVMNVIGDVKNRDCILIDDIVNSAGTLCNAAVALMDQGAKSVSAYVTHGVLSGGAVARVAASPMEKMVITNSIQPTEAVRVSPNVRPLSIATLMAEAIKRISEETSVSSLFDLGRKHSDEHLGDRRDSWRPGPWRPLSERETANLRRS